MILVFASCSEKSKNLTYKDFSGKALKERTIDELQQAKFDMEHGYVMIKHKMDTLDNGRWFSWMTVEVPELNFEAGGIGKMFFHDEDVPTPDRFVGYNNLLERINHEIELRADTVISKEELYRLKGLQE